MALTDCKCNCIKAGSKKIWRRLALAVLLLTVAALASVQIHKYFQKVTIVGRNVKRKDSMFLPAFSFCPGFRSDVVQHNPWHSPSYDILGEHDDDNPVGGGGKLSELWKLATFKLEEVVILVDFKGVKNRTEDRYTPQTLKNATCVKVEEQETTSGKCFTVLSSPAPECTMKRREFITVLFNLSSVYRKTMDLTFHHPEDPFGLNEENWSGEVSSTTIQGQGVYNIGLGLRVSVANHNTDWSEQDFFKCVEESFYEALANATKEGKRLCWHPAFTSMLRKIPGKSNIALCANVSSFTATNRFLVDTNIVSSFQTKCPKPTRETTYPIVVAKQQYSPALENGLSVVYILFQEPEVTFLEEKLILDESMLLSSLGGIIGIFLGWSLLDLTDMLLRVMEGFCNKFIK